MDRSGELITCCHVMAGAPKNNRTTFSSQNSKITTIDLLLFISVLKYLQYFPLLKAWPHYASKSP